MPTDIASLGWDNIGNAFLSDVQFGPTGHLDDISAGDYRWLTIVSADAPEGMELLLEPNAHEAAAAYQKAIFSDSIPATLLFVVDIQKEYERLKQLGVAFITEPTKAGPVTIAVFNYTCGNLIQLVEQS